MGPNILLALRASAALLSIIRNAANGIAGVNALLNKAREEDRDISDEELDSLALDTDRIHSETLRIIREAMAR